MYLPKPGGLQPPAASPNPLLARTPMLIQMFYCIVFRVRTILVLGYWVLGDIRRYWVVLLLADIFYCDTQYDTDQTAVGTVHMITV